MIVRAQAALDVFVWLAREIAAAGAFTVCRTMRRQR